ncbi:MAG: hypothetical protein H6700_03455 [Myxococcales bacterium]|nr:hypothetical protein [Myxococcales bacterium]MCB9530797.1 hypothetical protein [Myxococcales bacterium]
MANRKLKFAGIAFAGVLVVIVGIVTFFAATFPPTFSAPAVALEASRDPAVIAEGAYLFHSSAHCASCHVPVDVLKSSTRGEYAGLLPVGGTEIPFGPVGTLRAANLTSDPTFGIGAMTDAELAGIIRYGIRADGTPALFMVVASNLNDHDLVAIMSYLRSLPAGGGAVEPSEITVLGRVLMGTVMKPFIAPAMRGWESPANVSAGDTPSVERGRYIAMGPGNCVACHSTFPADFSSWTPSHSFAGGVPPMPDDADPSMEFAPPNLTPDPEHGWIRTWSEDAFLARFTSGERPYEGSAMPWECFKHMTDVDIRSLYLFLQSLPPDPTDPGPVHREAGWKPED